MAGIRMMKTCIVGAMTMMVLTACSTSGTGPSASAYAPENTPVDQARHLYVACLLTNRLDASCTSQRTRFANAVRGTAFKHPKTFQNHRQAASNQSFINLTVEKAISDTRRIALR